MAVFASQKPPTFGLKNYKGESYGKKKAQNEIKRIRRKADAGEKKTALPCVKRRNKALGKNMLCPKPFSLVVNGKKTIKPCGKCLVCRKLKSNEYAKRVAAHIEYNPDCFFLTLTYDNPETDIYSLSIRDLQLFLKRFRKHFPENKISYFGCGEYGRKNGRPHYHLLLFGVPLFSLNIRKAYTKKFSVEIMEKIWTHGFNTVGLVETASIRYVTGYIKKRRFDHEEFNYREPEFNLMSKNFGLQALKEQYEFYKGKLERKEPMPRYYIKKIREFEEEDPTGFMLQSTTRDARRIMNNKKNKTRTMREALTAVYRRNTQLEIDQTTLLKIFKQENAL